MPSRPSVNRSVLPVLAASFRRRWLRRLVGEILTQQSRDDRQQLLQIERLAQKNGLIGKLSLLVRQPRIDSADDDNGKRRRKAARAGENAPPGQTRHHHIGDEQFGRRIGNHRQGGSAIWSRLDAVARVLQDLGQQGTGRGVVIDDENSWHITVLIMPNRAPEPSSHTSSAAVRRIPDLHATLRWAPPGPPAANESLAP